MPDEGAVVSQCPFCQRRYADRQVRFCRYDGALLQTVDHLGSKWLGRTIDDKYRIVRYLGAGATAEVYAAEHVGLERKVALKLLNEESSGKNTVLERFRREARLIASLTHPNVVRVEDFGSHSDGTLYMAMELLSGSSLEWVLTDGPLDEQTTLNLALQICDGLIAAHDGQIIHRDIKPGNVFLHYPDSASRRCQVKLLDLGLAKHLGDNLRSNLTMTGTVFGTPEYMSPEQALGNTVDARTDIYALGIMLYEMLFGVVPFTAPSFISVLTKHMTEPLVWPDERANELKLHPDWEELILAMVAKKPEDRPQSVSAAKLILQELADAFPAFADTLRPPQVQPSAPSVERLSTRASNIDMLRLADARGVSRELVELAPDVYWVGSRDGHVLECNSYLRRYSGNGAQISVLIDPGPPKDLAVISEKLKVVLGSLDKLDFLFLNHQDPDVCANGATIQQANPRAHVICSEDTWRLVQFYGLRRQSHLATESFPEGRMLLSTSHAVQFVPTPYCHFRGAVMYYDLESRILFSGDLFGGLSQRLQFRFDDSAWRDIEIFHELYMPSGQAIRLAIERVRSLDPPPRLIAPQHGMLIEERHIPDVLDRMERLTVGVDLLGDAVGKEGYLTLANAILRGLRGFLDPADITALLCLYGADGSFPNLFVLSGTSSIVDIKVEPRAAIRALVRDAVELCEPQRRSEIASFIQQVAQERGLASALRTVD